MEIKIIVSEKYTTLKFPNLDSLRNFFNNTLKSLHGFQMFYFCGYPQGINPEPYTYEAGFENDDFKLYIKPLL